jgi:hypothetical protein
MKMFEVTNAQDKLDLLRLIMDNTWTAIRQEAEVEAKKKAVSKVPKPKAIRIPAPKLQAVAKPNPNPANKPLTQAKPTQAKPLQASPIKPINTQLTPTEREELAKRTATQIGITAQ